MIDGIVVTVHHIVRELFGFLSVCSRSESVLVGPKDPSTPPPSSVSNGERADLEFRAVGRQWFLLRLSDVIPILSASFSVIPTLCDH